MFNHPDVVATRTIIRTDFQTTKTILVVETHLALSANDPAYDDSKFNELMNAVRDYFEANSIYDSVEVDRV